MPNLLLLFVCLFLGIILQWVRSFPKDAHLTINSFIIYVCLPALTLLYTSEINFKELQVLPLMMPYIIYMCSFVFFYFLSPLLGFDRYTTGALTITAGISSISFVGFPIFELLYGREGLKIGIVMSQAGSFVVCGTLGIMTASFYSSSEPSLKKMLGHIFTFPPFLTFCVALLLNLAHFHFPTIIVGILEKLGSPFSVLALISIGLQVDLKWESSQVKPLFYGLLFKLLIAPLIIFLIYVILLNENTWRGHLCVIGAGLGSMNTASIIAVNYRLNPQLVSKMLGFGIPLSLITIFIWYYFLNYML